MSVLPDPAASRAVLVGVDRYRHLDSLPAVSNNLEALAGLLCDPLTLRLPRRNVSVLGNPEAAHTVVGAVRRAAAEASDTLLVYYAGHGLVDGADQLCLALPHTESGRVETALPYDWLRQVLLLDSRAERHVVILDCCYSGLALGRMSPGDGLADHAAVEGSFLMAAAAETRTALAPAGAAHTAFTGALLDTLRHGIPGGPGLLDLGVLYQHLRKTLAARGHPVPQARNRNSGHQVALARNHTKVFERPSTVTGSLPPDAGHPRQPSAQPVDRPTGLFGVSRTLHGQTTEAATHAVSPDGSLLAVGHDDGTVRMWDPATCEEIGGPFIGHTGKVLDMAFSPDGTLLATSSLDSTVRLWRTSTQRPAGDPITERGGYVFAVAFSPDGTELATTNRSGTIRLWNPATCLESGELVADTVHSNRCVTYSPDGTLLATAGNRAVRLWDRTSHQPVGDPISGHQHDVFLVTFSPDGSRLATASIDRTARLWSRETGRPIGFPLTHPGGEVMDLAFSPDGRVLATAGGDTKVRFWDPVTSRAVGTPLSGHRYRVQRLGYLPDGTLVTNDATLRLWSPVRTGPPAHL
ncbi:caspase family protein [Streptomyces sp. NPDC005017]|uniref:caspase, EACC1-associated type n=1 Tax=Streptomyces sp. NPDC005017 TaxID=3364706 RepID=UPI0036CA62D1